MHLSVDKTTVAKKYRQNTIFDQMDCVELLKLLRNIRIIDVFILVSAMIMK